MSLRAPRDEECVIRRLLHEQCDPNDIPIERLRSAAGRLIELYRTNPYADLAIIVLRVLNALEMHEHANSTAKA
ncbi:MAG: hypothetical protein AAF384_09715 [Pseudomonadota bacterium]